MRRGEPRFRVGEPSLGDGLARLGCACVLAATLAACQPHHAAPAANASVGAVARTAQAAQPPANASQLDQLPADANAAEVVNATQTPEEAARLSMALAEQNADCVDQLIKSQPFGETRAQIIDNVTKACLPIARSAVQSPLTPPGEVERSERAFVTAQAHALIDGPAPSGSAQQPVQPPPHPPTNETTAPLSNATRG